MKEGRTGPLESIQPDEKLVRRVERVSGATLLVLTLAALLIFSVKTAVSVFLGGGIITLSFQVLKWQLKRALLNPGRLPSKAGLFASYYLRFLGTLFLIFIVITCEWASPLPLLAGLSVVSFSIAAVGGRELLSALAKKGEG